MVFSSILFLFRFLPLAILLYYVVPKRFRNGILFLESLIFYAWGEPVYIVIMLFSTIVDYMHGRMVEHFLEAKRDRAAKATVVSSVIINLSLLCFFKYYDFLISVINQILKTSIPQLSLALPIGISFYTFQTMSYTIDIYRGEAKAQKNILSFGAYVAMFPQLIAGPIVQYKTIASELKQRTESVSLFADGVRLFLIGLGKKVLFANNIGMLWDTVNAMQVSQLSVLSAWLGILAFAFQIYFDFSGYSDMAIGLGKMFGFHFPKNFDYPYMSKNVTEFWRRWHMTLGGWFRDYVYIPLGGNRKGIILQIRNILVVWMLTGIWHGASYNFILWGLYYGVFLIIEKVWLLKWLKKTPVWVSRTYSTIVVLIGWTIFAFDSISDGMHYIGILFGNGNLPIWNDQGIYLLYNYAILFVLLIIGSTDLPKRWMDWFKKMFHFRKTVIVFETLFLTGIFIWSIAYLVDATYNPFLYFRF